MSPSFPVIYLTHLQDLADAIRRLCRVTETHGQRSPETQRAAFAALNAMADRLPLLNKCRSDFGCYRITPERLAKIEEWASLDHAEKAEAYDYFASDLTSPPKHDGGVYQWHSWGEQLDCWMGRLSASPKGARQAGDGAADDDGGQKATLRPAAHTNNARELRAVAAAFREWGRKAGPSGRDPSTVTDEEREAARQALLLAVKHRKIIKQARHDYDCAEGVICAGVFDDLNKVGAEHDRGADLGDFWHYAHDLTGKHLPGNVSFPDELDRWASRLEMESVGGENEGAAQKIIVLCDEMLRLGREPGSGKGLVVTPRDPSKRPTKRPKREGETPPDTEAVPAVGEYKAMSGPSGLMGRMGQAWGEAWDTLAAEFDSRAERLADLVKALDSTYDTGTFYSPYPVSVWEAYPKARKGLPDGERQWYRNNWHGEITADDFFAQVDALQEARTLTEWTKMQWPGRVMEMGDHRVFLSDPGFVRVFDQRFNTLKAWAAERARQERDEKAAERQAADLTPENDATLIYQAAGADTYNIPKSVLCKAAKKKPSEPGYLWSGRGRIGKEKRKRVWHRKKDLEKIARSRKALGRASKRSATPDEKPHAPVAPRVSGKKNFEANAKAFFEKIGQEDTESED
jgi:hypothetical protein